MNSRLTGVENPIGLLKPFAKSYLSEAQVLGRPLGDKKPVRPKVE